MGKESKNAEAIVDRHQDDPLARERLAVVPRLGARAYLEAAPVDPHHHRQAVIS
jgi:hypothetical protein